MDSQPDQQHKPHANRKQWALFVLRWTIAIAGIYWVVANISLYDRVLVAGADGWPVSLRLARQARDDASNFIVRDPTTGAGRVVARTDLIARTDRQKVTVRDPAGHETTFSVLGLKVTDDKNRAHWPIIVAPPRNIVQRYFNVHNAPATVISPSQLTEPYAVEVAYPLIDAGLLPIVRDARAGFLWAAIIIFPITFIITSMRWNELLKVLGIFMGMRKAFAVNMVGAFYNTFLPGSTGGDVLKAYYAARLAPDKRTRAVLSVIVDRVIGLLALIILGGAMAGYLAYTLRHSTSASPTVVRKCLQVAIGSAVIIIGTIIATALLFIAPLRRKTGLDFIIRKLPKQDKIAKAKQAMELYLRKPSLLFGAIMITFPVHATVIASATLAGMAFHLNLKPWYYWVVVPVVVLAGSIPISPQGAGVMEFFAVILTRPQCTVSQAFALTMSIRLVQILWNLTGGFFVLRGGYHAPTEREQESLSEDSPTEQSTAPTTV